MVALCYHDHAMIGHIYVVAITILQLNLLLCKLFTCVMADNSRKLNW